MNKKLNLLLFAVLLLSLSISTLSLSACKDDTDKSNLNVSYDNTHTVYEGDTLDSLKPYLTVTYTDKDGNASVVADYTLSGTLAKGESTVTVEYNNLTSACIITVTAIPETYTVTFKAEDVVVDTQNYTAENKNITEPDVPDKTGYNGVWENYSLTTGDITVNAAYTAKQYTVTLNYNGATGGDNQQNITVTYDREAGNLPIPEKTGYGFTGWYYDGTSVNYDTIWTYDNDNAELTAQWSINEYTVTFKADGEIVDVKTYTVENKNITEPNVPDKTGYTGCWEEYSLTAGDVTVDAVYTAKQYTVTLDYDGATDDNTKQTLTVTFDQEINLLPCPRKQGHEFAGWTFNDQSVTTSTVWEFDGNATFIAQWLPCTEGLQYELALNKKSYEVVGIGVAKDNDIIIPAIHNGKPVISIGTSAFKNCTAITSVEIPSSVTTVGENAFLNCTNLVKVTFAEDSQCKVIGAFALSGCSNLVQIKIPANIRYIDYNTFNKCSNLKNIEIPLSVKDITDFAFSNCDSLANVFYRGTAQDWNKINVGHYNTCLKSAVCYYYSETEPELNADGTGYNGNYWHYVDGKAAVWTKEIN